MNSGILDYGLFIIYLSLLIYLVTKLPFFRKSAVGMPILVGVFACKVFCGLLYGWLHLHQYGGGDTWTWFKDSMIIYESLFENWPDYIKLTFAPNNISNDMGLWPYIKAMGYWNDTPAYLVVRLNAFFNLFSLGNYYINSLFFNFLSFTGLVCLFRFFNVKSNKAALMLFFIPSVMFWFSGIHKDPVVLVGVGFLLFGISLLIENTANWKGWWLSVSGAVLTFLVRDYLLLLMLPGILSLIWSSKQAKHTVLKFALVYSAFLLAGSLIQVPESQLTFIDLFNHKQDQFLSIFPGESQIIPPNLSPGFLGLMKALPFGFINGTFRPHPLEADKLLHWLSCLEIYGLYFISLILFIRQKRFAGVSTAKGWFSIFFFLTMLTMVGTVVPNIGAICRYRALVLPFLLMAASGKPRS